MDLFTFIADLVSSLGWPIAVLVIAWFFRGSLQKIVQRLEVTLEGLRLKEFKQGNLKVTFEEAQQRLTAAQHEIKALPPAPDETSPASEENAERPSTDAPDREKKERASGSQPTVHERSVRPTATAKMHVKGSHIFYKTDEMGRAWALKAFRFPHDETLVRVAIQNPQEAVALAWGALEETMRFAAARAGMKLPASATGVHIAARLAEERMIAGATFEAVLALNRLRLESMELMHTDFAVKHAIDFIDMARKAQNLVTLGAPDSLQKTEPPSEEVTRRADELVYEATDLHGKSGREIYAVTFLIENELDLHAARLLQQEGLAEISADRVTVQVTRS